MSVMAVQRLPQNRFWLRGWHFSVAVSWRRRGCSSIVYVGHRARHGRSGQRVRAAALIWRGALIIQKLWWEIIAKGFSTQVAIVQEVVVPRLLCRNFVRPGFPWRRWSLEFLCLQREVRPLPWTVMIHQMKWGNPSQHSNLTCTKPSKMCVQTPACSTPKGNSPPTHVSHCHGKITMS